MTNIILMSDSHYNTDFVKKVKKKFPNSDYYIHCGDSLMPPEKMVGFMSVTGNLDDQNWYPQEIFLEIEDLNIWVLHGHKYVKKRRPEYKALVRHAKKLGVDVVFFGHTHTYCDMEIDGIRLLNPGSTWKSRDGITPCTLMEIKINKNKLEVTRINYATLLPC